MPHSLSHLLLINFYLEIYNEICYLIFRISTVWKLPPAAPKRKDVSSSSCKDARGITVTIFYSNKHLEASQHYQTIVVGAEHRFDRSSACKVYSSFN